MKINYKQFGDYFLPLLKIGKKNIEAKDIGKYGRYRLNFIKDHRTLLYNDLLLDGNLNQYLYDVDVKCNAEVTRLLDSFKVKENITEDLKEDDQIEWVRRMGNAKNRAEEIVISEYVFE